jgi:hypothetical protein
MEELKTGGAGGVETHTILSFFGGDAVTVVQLRETDIGTPGSPNIAVDVRVRTRLDARTMFWNRVCSWLTCSRARFVLCSLWSRLTPPKWRFPDLSSTSSG